MPFHKLDAIKSKEILPGFHARLLHMTNMTYSHVTVAAGHVLPEHHHVHQQVSILLSGDFEFTMEGETRIVSEGDIVEIPPNVPHSGKAITDCVILDMFSPVREDYK